MALTLVRKCKIEAAYRSGDLFGKQRPMFNLTYLHAERDLVRLDPSDAVLDLA